MSPTEEGQNSSTRKVKRVKTFTGCWGCRSRKIKCDENTPQCSQCLKAGIKCAGYDATLVWMLPGQKTYPAGRRRALQYDLTWSRSPAYDSEDIDALIVQCDLSETQQTAQPSEVSKTVGPFTVFPIMTNSSQLHPDIDRAMRLSTSPRLLTEPDDSTSYLLRHYTIHIAPNMMPFKDPRNPWQSSYPLLSQCGDSAGHQSLYHAILAQSAGNLAHLGTDREINKALNLKHQARSIEELRKSIADRYNDFSIALASMLILVFAGNYDEESNAWRLHLNGAWDLLTSCHSSKPWLENDFAWVTTQSLCLMKVKNGRTTQEEQTLITSIAERSDFGFTTGSTPELMACIMEVDALHNQISGNSHGLSVKGDLRSRSSRSSRTPSLLNTSSSSTGPQLEATSRSSAASWLSSFSASSKTLDSPPSAQICQGDSSSAIRSLIDRIENCVIELTDPIVRTHHRIFLLGTLIYAHRQLYSPPPLALCSYLSSLLDCIDRFVTLGGGQIALWPVFMAAVEVYLPEHQRQVREWMDRADAIGVPSRKNVRRLVLEIWRTREHVAGDAGIEEGEIVVDWRVVMDRLGMDVLLF